RVIPMLPELISNGLASLQPRKNRFAKTVFIEFSPEGHVTDVTLHRSVIRSSKRLTYEEVDAFLESPEAFRRKFGKKVCELLLRMRDLARLLRRKRQERGALELSMPELKVDLDRNEDVVGAHVVPYTESHQMIEEFMLVTNEAVAEQLRNRDWLFLRRVHKPPALRRLNHLREFVAELGYAADELDNPFSLQRLLQTVRGTPHEYAVNYAVLRSLKRAAYSPADEGHFALASDCYCHFTSPIRRYPDLTIHRLVDALILGQTPPMDPAALAALGRHCTDQENRAEMAERELTKLKLLRYLNERVGMEMNAVITGVEKFGLFAQGLELPCDGFIHINALSDDYYVFDAASRSLTGRMTGRRLRLGDVVRVAVAGVDLERRELDFRLLG
ncbi:MAG: RNB domain-containing ribonuclease, partial [Planctomycetota bacterium]